MRDESQFAKISSNKDSGLIPENLKSFPVAETTKALIRVTPFDYRDPWFKTAFDLYHSLTPGMYSIITLLIFWKIAYHALRLDPVSKIADLFRNGVTCLFFLKFFPNLFEKISILIQGLQEKILDFSMTSSAIHQATVNSSHNFLKVIAVLALAQFAGMIGWIFGALVAVCWFLPMLIYVVYHYAFKLGIVVLIYSSPFIFVAGTIYGLGIAISVFFWMLIGSMLWPIYWVGIGRVAFQAMGEMNIVQAFGFTLVVGLFQVWVPIKIMQLMKGVNPGESAVSLIGSVGRGIASIATALPLGAVAAPVIGMASGARAYLGGARLTGLSSSASQNTEMSLSGRMMAGVKAHRMTSGFQSGIGMTGSGTSGGHRAVHTLGRMGAHLNRAKGALRGAQGVGKKAPHQAKGGPTHGNGKNSNEEEPLYENPSVHGLNLKDLTRYGMLRSSEKQAQRWHNGTLGFLSAGRKAGAQSNSKGPAKQIESNMNAPRQLETRFKPSALLGSSFGSDSKNNSVIHMGGEMHSPTQSAAKPRIVPIDPNRKRNAQWLEQNSKYFNFKEASFPVSTAQGIEQVKGYAAYSKKTGQPKTYFVPRNRFQELEALEKSQIKL